MKAVKFFFFFLFTIGLTQNLWAADKIRVVATITTLADFIQQVTGDLADIYTIAAPKRNIHFYAPTPKDVLKVKKADVLVHTGLDLEAWRPPLLETAGNARFLGEAKFEIDVSKGIKLVEVPTILSRSQGDLHIFGNPHYWVDPENAKIMLETIANRLSELYPEHASEFQKNAKAYRNKIDEKMKEWLAFMEQFRGSSVITYHKSWPYFADRFGLKIVEQLEPVPGIPPTAKHLAKLRSLIPEKNVKLIIKETFGENRTSEKLSRETGVKVAVLIQNPGAAKEVQDYFSMMDYNFNQIRKALKNE
ncbi:MAG: zinc ABC transporter substrate-binding protein [Candidatus Omnitrophica bacterium]|nr:zinc ABC transporter substrate-binding protein [Candidatus Omnitrophota bacterium]